MGPDGASGERAAPWPFVAYLTTPDAPAELLPVPSAKSREWIDETPNRFARRCLPLMVASQAGWVLPTPIGFRARWNGSPYAGGIEIQPGDPGHPANGWVSDHFGSGIVTFNVPYLFRTPPGIALLVRGAPNFWIAGAQPLEGLVETDWPAMTFTMNWRILAPNRWVRFAAGDPICFLQPISVDLIEAAEPVIKSLAEAPEIAAPYRDWSEARQAFNDDLARRPEEWQKDYFLGKGSNSQPVESHRTRVQVASFAGAPATANGRKPAPRIAAVPESPASASRSAIPSSGVTGSGTATGDGGARWQVADGFYDRADELRTLIEDHFDSSDPARAETGVWQVFHIKGQYAYLRTMARRVIPADMVARFQAALSAWGWENLGMGQVTDSFLSFYPPGCRQGLHNDSGVTGHAYVYSLSHMDAAAGGSTLLLKTDPYWGTPRAGQPGAGSEFADSIQPAFNRLLVFDTRLIHGVEPALGEWDPLQCRFVLHGQFLPGGIHVQGKLGLVAAETALSEADDRLAQRVPELYGSLRAAIGTRIDIDADGRVNAVNVLSKWIAPLTDDGIPGDLMDTIVAELSDLVFSGGPATVTFSLPLNEHPGPQTVYRKADKLKVAELDNEFTVTDAQQRVHRLNPSAMFILECCDGQAGITDIAKIVQEAFGLPEVPHDLVRDCIIGLRKAGLITRQAGNDRPWGAP